MARPKKDGLDYFPLDVNMDQDDKVLIIISKYGFEGFGILVKLLMEIYKNGYYYKWTEKEQIIFSSRVSVNINSIQEIVNECIKWGLFNEEIFTTHHVLTSKGIQERYLLATSRRVKSDIKEELRLVSVDINSNSNENVVEESTQSKVKESKRNKNNKPSSPKRVYDEDSIHYKLAERLYKNILVNNPEYKKPNLQTWSNDVRLMMERDNRTEEQIRYLIDWVQDDSFWKTNILSISKLREKYDQLVMRVKEGRSKTTPKKSNIDWEEL